MRRGSRCSSGKSGHLTSTQVLPDQKYKCSHCVLIFASKLILLEHLGEDHDMDVCEVIKHATSSGMEDAGRNINATNDNPREKCASALQPEENQPTVMLTKVDLSKQAAVEKSNSCMAEPTSKNNLVINPAGHVEVSQKVSRGVTQYCIASSSPNVNSRPSDKVGAANTSKKTFTSRKCQDILPGDCYCLPSELDIQLVNNRTDNNSKNIVVPTFASRKSHFPDSSRLMLEFSDGEEDPKLPKDEMNHKERHGNADIFPGKQMEVNPSKQSPMLEAVQAEMYKCDLCIFNHKSAVAMFVHYQKQHPKVCVTLNKIKQSRRSLSDTKPRVNMDTPTQQDTPKDTPEKNPPSEKTTDKSKLLPEENTSAANPKDFTDISSRKQHKMFEDAGSPSNICNDSNPTRILSHQKTKGVRSSPRKVTPPKTTEQGEAERSPMVSRSRSAKKALISARLTPTKNGRAIGNNDAEMDSCSGDEASASPADGGQDKALQRNERAEDPVSDGKHVEKNNFCPKCNYGNSSMKAVLAHYKTKHRESDFRITAHTVSLYTASILRQMKQSTSQNDNVAVLSSGLPLPILLDDNMLFCHMCNYSSPKLPKVLAHQTKAHSATEKSEKKVLAYSAEVYAQPREEQLKFNQFALKAFTSHVESKSVLQATVKPFVCPKCVYTAPYVYLLRRHLLRKHLIHQTGGMILRRAFDNGSISEGYYCRWCNFSSQTAAQLYEHVKLLHKSNLISFNYINDHLHVAPKGGTSRKPSDAASLAPSQGSGSKRLRKRSCHSLKASSMKGIANLKLVVRLPSVREKGAVLDGRSSGDDDQNSHVQADGRQASEEPETSAGGSAPSCKMPRCRVCSAVFSSWHGLKIHYGRKHLCSVKIIEKCPSQPFDLDTAIASNLVGKLIYKCPSCVYVHTTRPGILAHSHQRHPTIKIRAKGLESLEAFVSKRCKGNAHQSGECRISGYMCQLCKEVHNSMEKFKMHSSSCHGNSGPGVLKDLDTAIASNMVGKLIYKCPSCVYVHATRPGIFAHSHRKHPTIKIRAKGLESLEAFLPKRCKSSTHQSGECHISGYMCQLCKEVHNSMEKFKMHFSSCHGNSGPGVLKPPVKYAMTKQLQSRYHATRGLGLKKAFLIKIQAGLMKCPFCKHMAKSKDALIKHVKDCSKNRLKRHVFKCSICSYTTLRDRYLKKHYESRHGTAAMGAERSFNCRLCPYVSQTRSYLTSHYTRIHKTDAADELEENQSMQCKKCSEPTLFSSYRRLGSHYTSFHKTDLKMDFKVLFRSSKKRAVAGYTCHHCSLKFKTTKELCCHLEDHTAQRMKTVEGLSVTPPVQCTESVGQSPTPQTSPEMPQSSLEMPQSSPEMPQTSPEMPQSSPEMPQTSPEMPQTSPEMPQTSPDSEPESQPPAAKAQAFGHCGRGFTSPEGLGVHERSHEAVAAVQQPDPGPAACSEDVFEGFTRFEPGSLKPFHCSSCSHRCSSKGLLESHVTEQHLDPPAAGELPDTNAGPPESVQEEEGTPEAAGEPPATPPDLQKDDPVPPQPAADTSEHKLPDSVYSEPAAVQRQLSHYRSMPPAISSSAAPQAGGDDTLLRCEFCDFTTGYQSSVRRHYANLHSKKLFCCRNCGFFTGLRTNLDRHKETGHSIGPRDKNKNKKTLRCPLCLYHTKMQNHMVDHIVLHRKERVVPMEVRRPKLSRYLEGVVFRCHQCTFASGSSDTLKAHALKHNGARPYRCRLCYFDCMHLSELEAHLCDKHQVVRNHELVGQVSLDHLQTRASRKPQGDEDGDDECGGSNPREGNNEDEDAVAVAEGGGDVQQREKHQEHELHRGNISGLEAAETAHRRRKGGRARPTTANAVSERKRFRGAGLSSKPGSGSESAASELGGEGAARTPHNDKRAAAGGGQNPESPPDAEAQKSAAEGERNVAPHRRSPKATRQGAGSDCQQQRRRQQQPRDVQGRWGTLGDAASEGPVHRRSTQGRMAAEGAEEAETSLAKGPLTDPAAAPCRPASQDHGAFSCTYCGRIFSSGPELQRHAERHGM